MYYLVALIGECYKWENNWEKDKERLQKEWNTIREDIDYLSTDDEKPSQQELLEFFIEKEKALKAIPGILEWTSLFNLGRYFPTHFLEPNKNKNNQTKNNYLKEAQ